MRDGEQLHPRTNKRVRSDSDLGRVEEYAVDVHERACAQVDVLAVVAEEGGLDPDILADLAEQL